MVFARRATPLCICIPSLASCHINWPVVIGVACGAAADSAGSTTRNPRRVQPFATGRYSCAWKADESDPPNVGAFRDVPRQLASHLRVDVLSGPGPIFGTRESDVWTSVLGCMAEHRHNVR